MTQAYSPSVRPLIAYGSALEREDWPDYVAQFKLTQHDVPELVRLIDDPAFHSVAARSPEAWARVHAWRAIAQLRSPEGIEPMLHLIDAEISDRALAEFEKVAATVGAAAVPMLIKILSDPQRSDSERTAVVDALAAVASDHAEARAQIVDALSKQLGDPRHNSIELNAVLVKALLRLRAKESLPVVKKAFRQQQVDLDMVTWDEVESELG